MKPEEIEQSMLDKLREYYEGVLKTKARLGLRLTPIESLKLRRLRAMSKDTDLRSVFQPFFDGLEQRRKEFNQIKSQNMKTEKEFAVKSDSFALYEAFKKECEGIGWKYNDCLVKFDKDEYRRKCSCMYFSTEWNDNLGCAFSLSNVSDNTLMFKLDGQFSEALAYAKRIFEESKKKKMTYEDVEKVIGTRTSSYCCSVRVSDHGQCEKLLAINKLMNVAVYLNPKREMAEWSISLYSSGTISIMSGMRKYGQPFFISKESAQQAIEILGEDVIRLALS